MYSPICAGKSSQFRASDSDFDECSGAGQSVKSLAQRRATALHACSPASSWRYASSSVRGDTVCAASGKRPPAERPCECTTKGMIFRCAAEGASRSMGAIEVGWSGQKKRERDNGEGTLRTTGGG